MNTRDTSSGKCSVKAVWLALYFIFQVLGFTFSLLALISPSWQFVYLEEGRTEHHHGLWLDCKRDYSNEYGRPREYYEKLFRLDHMQGPFDQFSLPPLQCVYKFDYWIDEEDLYEHGYDENRLQDDAYQHLFLGWKIAALTALTFSLVCAFISLVIGICAFCHRLLVCVSTVLSTIAVITALIGNVVFFMYARYQDNNIIKQEDDIYEQYFGWSFYTSLVGNACLFLAAVIGCVATSVAMSLGKAKLVKIELEDNDSHQLISAGSSDQPFKRSFSAVYKIDSVALRKWEREYMKSVRRSKFNRANSLPNIKKGQTKPIQSPAFMHSSSDISKAFTDPARFTTGPMQPQPAVSTTEFHHTHDQYTRILPHGGSAFPASTNEPVYPPPVLPKTDDVVYEYVDHNTISLNSSIKLDTLGQRNSNGNSPIKEDSTTLNVYDRVMNSKPPSLENQSVHINEDDEYLRPKVSTVATTIPVELHKEADGSQAIQNATTSFGASPGHRRMPSTDFSRRGGSTQIGGGPLITPVKSFTPTLKALPPEVPVKPAFLKKPLSKSTEIPSQSATSFHEKENDEQIMINTFDEARRHSNNRSLTSLSQNGAEQPINIFDYSETNTLSSSPASSADNYGMNRGVSSKLLHTVLRNEAANAVSTKGVKETTFDWPSTPSPRNTSIVSSKSGSSLRSFPYAPSEMDRSIGASTMILPHSPTQRIYEFDSDDDRPHNPVKSRKPDSETFV
uniref:Protein ECM7 n=1 Tax=Panagrellus redivivus TaxID=6233 RepID=A0A7E5A0Y6_PANRE